MKLSEARKHVFSLLTSQQIEAVVDLVLAYELEQMEEVISASDPEIARERVLAARDIRALLNKPRG